MNGSVRDRSIATFARARSQLHGRLFWKYVAAVAAVVCVALPANWIYASWLSYQDHEASLIRIQREQAEAAAAKIGQFVTEIENQLAWVKPSPGAVMTLDERRVDALRLLRQVPAITELTLLDASGREQLRVSRVTMDTIGSGTDLSREPAFLGAVEHSTYYGPVYFRRGSEPYLTLSVRSSRRDASVSVAEVNLIFVWDVVSQIKVGQQGRAYVVDAGGRLVAHPDISLVLRNSDFSGLPQVQAARAGLPSREARDVLARPVLTAHAAIAPLGWLVFVELPRGEAYAPVYASLRATGLVLLGGLLLAVIVSVVLARKMVTPIRALQAGAAQIGAGALDHRIEIRTGDELEALGDQFNHMAAQLQDSYATLERKVEERTHQLELANLAKARFLAAASHDLRQPLHALNLFVAQLRSEKNRDEQTRLIERINAAVAAMNELFNALLDMSKLDAGVLTPDITEFPVEHLLKRIETTFAAAAREKGLRLRVVSSRAWIRSDFILLERIMLNLVSNAIRYTSRGSVVVGCRRRRTVVRMEVWDSGSGIPENQQRDIFGEFYQLAPHQHDREHGLGLGLSIVERLGRLLEHPIELKSRIGFGSCFSVSVPLAAAQRVPVEPEQPLRLLDPARGKVILVIDDDRLVIEGMTGLLRSWGCTVLTAESESAAMTLVSEHERPVDLIISDYRLTGRSTGIDLIERLRMLAGSAIPAFLITGDTAPERLREAQASGYQLLHKPVDPMALRAALNQYLKSGAENVARLDITLSAL